MADPQGVAIAFEDGALVAEPTWTRIDDPAVSSHVAEWTITRGRSSELDRMATGTATIKINDPEGVFDPTNTTGPYYGFLDPMKQAAIALWNPVAEEWSTVFRGFVNEWLGDLDPSRRMISTTLELADAFELFAGVALTPGDFGADTVPTESGGDVYFDPDTNLDATKTRMDALLDDMYWPSELREIFTGNVGLFGTVAARNDGLLSVLLDAADADFPGVATILMSKEGLVMYHGRYARFNPDDVEYHIRHWKVGDGDAWEGDTDVAPLRGLQFRRSKQDIINQAMALPMGITDDAATVEALQAYSTTSSDVYGIRGESWENLLTSNGEGPTTAIEETYKFAEYYVQNYASPRTRATSAVLRTVAPTHPNAEALWDLMCNVEISDIVTLTTTHPGGGGFNEDFFVEGIQYDVQPLQPDYHDITLTLDLSPTAYFTNDPFPH